MKSLINKSALLVAITFMFSAIFTINAMPAPDAGSDVYSIIEQKDNLSTFEEIVKTAKMDRPLQTEGPYTILAPSNEAFNKIDRSTIQRWKTDPAAAQKFLSSHIVEGKLSSDKIKSEKEIETINGKKVTINANGNKLTAGGADIITQDLTAKNGTVYILDSCVSSNEMMGQKMKDTMHK